VASCHRRKVRSLIRAVGFLASFVAVVGGCVAFVRWLDSEDVPSAWVVIAIAAVGAALIWIRKTLIPADQSAFVGWQVKHMSLAWGLWGVVTGAGLAVIAGRDGGFVELGGATVIFATGTGILMWDLYERDKASRKVCPDCCEQVKVGARICRYCGYRWTVADQAPPDDPG
jgi:hypothetical protein